MTTRRAFLGLLVAIPATAGLIRPALAAQAPVFVRNGAAINGYDPVAYFTQGKPVRGVDGNSLNWKGAKWRFSSAETMAMFESNPEKFAPQYGGYCAYAVASGSTAKTEPDAWTVYNDRLYLNYSKGIRRRWRKDKDGYIAAADANWPGVLQS